MSSALRALSQRSRRRVTHLSSLRVCRAIHLIHFLLAMQSPEHKWKTSFRINVFFHTSIDIKQGFDVPDQGQLTQYWMKDEKGLVRFPSCLMKRRFSSGSLYTIVFYRRDRRGRFFGNGVFHASRKL